MAQAVPDIGALVKLLNAAVQGTSGQQYIVLDAALLPEAGTLVGYLDAPGASLRIDQKAGTDLIQPVPPVNPTSVRIVGTGDLFSPKGGKPVGYDVEIVGKVPQPNDVTLDLTGTPSTTSGWSFASNFPTLPKFLGAKTGKAGLVWQDSFFNTIGFSKPVFTVATYKGGPNPEGLGFAADLDPTAGVLGDHIGTFIQNTIPIAGTITQQATFPLIVLSGDSNYTVKPLLTTNLLLSTGNGDPQTNEPDYSTAGLDGVISISGFNDFHISGSVLEGSITWVLTITIDNPQDYSLARGLGALVDFVGGTPLSLPAGINAFASMYLASVTVGITPSRSAPSINMLGASIKYEQDWPLPLQGGSVTDVGVEWQIVDPFGSPRLFGSISGAFVIEGAGSGGNLVTLAITADISGGTGQTLPSVIIDASLVNEPGQTTSIDAIVQHFSGFNPNLKVDLDALSMQIDTGERTLLFYASIGTDLQILGPLLTITGASFGLQVTPNHLTGSVAVGFDFGNLPLAVSADYMGADAGWIFRGGIVPGTNPPTLGEWLTSVSSSQFSGVPATIGNIQLRGMALSYATKPKIFDFDTTVGWSYTIASFDWDLEAQVKFTADGAKTPTQYSGFLRGTISVNALAVSVIYAFDVAGSNTITFEIDYQGRTLTAVLSKNKAGEQILTVTLGNVSFGDIVGFLVGLAIGDTGWRLSSPWSVLYDINFDNLSLVINLTTKDVGITYKLGLDLGIVDIETIGLTYLNKAGTRTVDISITGRFVDQEYTEDNPLGWDLLNDPPPSPPGKGEQLLDLRYLGVGQNIAFRETRDFTTVLEVIEALRKDFTPVEGDDANPLGSLPAMRFSSDGNWLIGADFTVMETVSLAGIFNDPVLYGLRIALGGEKSGTMAGLAFEILYKKVTDDIGVYIIHLKLPDAMRQIQLGAVSITLPNVGIEIYTNGNFRVDVGFPKGGDFSGSFSVQVFPFVGFGGFYFAVLDGQTSDTVPKITNGTFSPVLELGIGLSVGLGKTINEGILSAGVTLTVEGIVEGTLAWFNPNDASTPSDRYMRVQGTIAVTGKLFGEVNFVIIQVRVSLTLSASATLLLESYEPAEVSLLFKVVAEASVKILFIKVHFSFEMELKLDFEIGEKGNAPWAIAQGSAADRSDLVHGQATRHRPRRLTAAGLLATMRQETGETVVVDFAAALRGPAGATAAPQEIDIIVLPAVTVADASSVEATGPKGASGPALQITMPLFIPNSIPASAATATEAAKVADGSEASAFNKLASAVFRWAIDAIDPEAQSTIFGGVPSDQVTIAHLQELAVYLQNPANRRAAFDYRTVSDFLARNFILRLSSPLGPSGLSGQAFAEALNGQAGATAAETSTTIFPMLPPLVVSPEGQPAIDFGSYHPVSAEYVENLEAYFNQLTNDPTRDVAKGPEGAGSGPVGATGITGATAGYPSMATAIFENYFAMLASGAVQEAIGLMKAYPYDATGRESLNSLATEFGGHSFNLAIRAGDTLERIAGRFGVPIRALRRANPWAWAMAPGEPLPLGASMTAPVGVSVETIAAANDSYPLARGVTLGIEDVRYQVRQGDSIASVAQHFDITDIRRIFEPTAVTPPGPSGPSGMTGLMRPNANAGNANLLTPGSRMWIGPAAGPTGATFGPTFGYRVSAGDLLGPTADPASRIAAFYSVRNQAELDWPFGAWYRQRLVDLNPGVVWDDIAPGATVTAPVAGLTGGVLSELSTTAYEVKDGDSIDLLASYLALQQIGARVPELAAPRAFYDGFRSRIAPQIGVQPGQVVSAPGFEHAVRPGETLNSLSARFAGQVPGTAMDGPGLAWANRAGKDVLQSLSVLALPTLHYRTSATGPASTLAEVAQHYNLTLDVLADGLASATGIFQPYGPSASGPRMTIPDVATRDLGTLSDDLVGFGKTNKVAAMVSRFLMHGMRVAKPQGPVGAANAPLWPPGVDLWGLYEMLGQQIPAPASLTAGYGLTFSKGATADWIVFADSPSGTGGTGPRGQAADLGLDLSAQYFAESAPSPTFSPQMLRGPSATPLYDETPPRYGLQKTYHWQAATRIPLPGLTGPSAPAAGEPTIWPFPDALSARIATALSSRGPTAQSRPYDVFTQRPGGESRALTGYAWASAVPVRIRRETADGKAMSNAYTILGASETGRDTLLQAWTYLQTAARPGDALHVLYAPNPTQGAPGGLASAKVDPDQTFILKSNLSTVTHSGVQRALMAAAGQSDFIATLRTPGPFLRMLWEASVTASGGFYLRYASQGGSGLPADLFATGDEAEIWLVLVLADQAASYPQRAIRALNNCAVIGENVLSSGANLYVQLDPSVATADDLVRVANVPAGSVSFDLARRDPTSGMAGASGPLSPAQRLDLTRSLYSLLGYNVAGNPWFGESNEAVPVGPAPAGPSGPTGQWVYRHTVPVSGLGIVNDMPNSPALPAAAANPYRGITGPQGASGPASRVQLDFRFHDLYGNQTQSTEPLAPLDVTVGYTDPLIGVASWPGTAVDYVFQDAGGSPELDLTLSFQTDSYVAGAGRSFAQASAAAASDAERLKQIVYQTQQSDLGFGLTSNIGDVALSGAELKAPMAAFAIKGKLFTDAAAKLSQVGYPTQTNDTLGGFAGRYRTTAGALAEANAMENAGALFTGSVVMPKVVTAQPMNTLRQLVEGQASSGTTIDCGFTASSATRERRARGLRFAVSPEAGPTSTALSPASATPAATALTVEELATNNKTRPLAPALILRTATRSSTVATSDPAELSLSALAGALQCPVYANVRNPDYPGTPSAPPTLAVGLIVDNFTLPSIIAGGLDLTMKAGGQTVTVSTDKAKTLSEIVDAFTKAFTALSVPITEGDVATAIQGQPGLIVPKSVLKHASFTVPQPPRPATGSARPVFSLADLPSAAGSVDDLAKWNQAAPGFFAASTPIYLNYSCQKPTDTDTLLGLAQEANVTLAQWAEFNQGSGLNPDVALKIPALSWWKPEDRQSAYSAYTAAATDSLETVADRVGLTGATGPLTLAAINREIPGLFRTGADVAGVTAGPGDSLQSIWTGLTGQYPTYDSFVAGIQGATGLFRPDGVIATPLPLVPGPASPSWTDLAKGFSLGISIGDPAERLVAANRTLRDFLRAGATVQPPAGATGLAPVAVGPYDTVETILQAYSQTLSEAYPGATITLGDLVVANEATADLTTPGQPFLLPPTETRLTSPFTPVIPPKGATQAQDKFVFPVRVSVDASRDRGLVAPDFQGATAVYRAESPVVPRGVSAGSDQLSLEGFAESFEKAFAAHQLKCAISKRHGLDAGPDEQKTIWAVNFGPSGVQNLAVSADVPQFYALQPLSTAPYSGTVIVQDYVTGQGLGATGPKRFDEADLDAWMRQVLSAIDLYLTPQYAVASTEQTGLTGQGGPFAAPAPSYPSDGPVGLAGSTTPARGVQTSPPTGSLTAGPSAQDFNAIVAAKDAIAGALKAKVSPILNIAGATMGPYIASAQEALYQQMLTRLSSAYTTDAIVQYPVGLTSSFPQSGALRPPKVSGRVQPDLPLVPKTATSIEAMAKATGVAPAFLAEILGAGQGIWQTGQTVTYPDPGGKTETIRAHDTLNAIAKRFGIPTDPSAAGYWEAWSKFIVSAQGGIGAQALLVPNGELPVTRIARQAGPGDTLTLLASFAGIDVRSFALANQGAPGIFQQGWTIDLTGFAPYLTTGTETLSGIAAALTGQGTATVQDLVDLATATKGQDTAPLRAARMLTAGRTLHSVQLLPDVTLSTSKVALAPDQGVPPPLTFLFGAEHESRFKKLFMNLKYVINELEFDIRDVQQAGDYRPSSWLSFVLPIGSGRGADVGLKTGMQQVQIPLPLRSYPTPPQVVGHSSTISDPGATTIPDARLWDYRFDFQTRNADQDTDHLEVSFNQFTSTDQQQVAQDQTALFHALARFISVSPQLMRDLALLTGLASGEQSRDAAVAVRALRVLVGDIVAALTNIRTAVAAEWPQQVYAYGLETSVDAVDRDLRDVTYVPEVPLGMTSMVSPPVWPSAVFVQSPTAPTGGTGPDAGFVQLKGGEGTYRYPPGITAGQPILQRVLYRERDIIRNKNAWSGVYIARNENLIAQGPVGASGYTGPVATRPDFIYRTPIVRFVNPLTPFVVNQSPISLASLTGPSGPPGTKQLAAHLTNMIDALLDLQPWSPVKAESLLQLLVQYAFAAASDPGGAPQLFATTPIRLAPTRPVDAATRQALVNELSANLKDWYRTTGPTGAAGYLTFEASVFSDQTTPGMTGQSRKPILRLDQLVLPFSDINWTA